MNEPFLLSVVLAFGVKELFTNRAGWERIHRSIFSHRSYAFIILHFLSENNYDLLVEY